MICSHHFKQSTSQTYDDFTLKTHVIYDHNIIVIHSESGYYSMPNIVHVGVIRVPPSNVRTETVDCYGRHVATSVYYVHYM